jgi:predicted porin
VPKPGSGALYIGVFGLLSADFSGSTCRAADLDLYGVGHLSYDGIDTGVSSSDYVHSNSSRLGIKGDQDLNDALSVYVQYESGVDLTGHGTGDGNGGATSTGQIFTRARDSFLGLRSADYGSIQFGRVGGLNQWLYDYDLFADQVGDLGNVWGGDGMPGRLDDAMEYLSPTRYGLQLDLTYVPDEGTHNQRDVVVKVDYKTDYAASTFKVGAAYANFGSGVGSGGSGGAPNFEAFAVTGSFEHDWLNVGGGFQREQNVGGNLGADRNQADIGAAAKLGTIGTLKAQYAWSGELTGVPRSGAHQIAAGVDYNAGTTTIVYVAYARTSNAANTAYSAFDFGHGDQGVPAILDGKSVNVFSVGLIYKLNLAILKANKT